MAFKLISVFALLCLAAVLIHAEEEESRSSHLVKRSGSGWTRAPGSPTKRKTLKDSTGQQIDYAENVFDGHQHMGYLAKGKQARHPSPTDRQGQKSTGGKPGPSGRGGR